MDHVVSRRELKEEMTPEQYARFNYDANELEYCNIQTMCAMCNQRKKSASIDYRDNDYLYGLLMTLLIKSYDTYISVDRVSVKTPA